MNNVIKQIKSLMNAATTNAQSKGARLFAVLTQKWVLNVLVLTQTCHRLDPNSKKVWNADEDTVPALQEKLLGVLEDPKQNLKQMVTLINAHLVPDQQSPEVKIAIAYVNEVLPSYDDRTLGNLEATLKDCFQA